MVGSEEIKAAVPMRELVERYGFKVNRNGYIKCPFHDDHKPSMKIYPKYAVCFSCGWKGGIVDFVMQLQSLTFMEALKRIDADFNLGLISAARRVPESDRWKYTKAHKAALDALDAAQTAYLTDVVKGRDAARTEQMLIRAYKTERNAQRRLKRYIAEHPTETDRAASRAARWDEHHLQRTLEFRRLFLAKKGGDPQDPEYIDACLKLDAAEDWLETYHGDNIPDWW